VLILLCCVLVSIPGLIGYLLAKVFRNRGNYHYDSVEHLNRLTEKQNAMMAQDISNKLLGRYDRGGKDVNKR
jgi:hypothetical protein